MQGSVRPPKILDERLAAALSHPTRSQALNILSERVASPKEISDEIDIDVSLVSHHVHKLVELDCAEEVYTKPRRGATEHFYRATVRHFFDADAWTAVPEGQRLEIVNGILSLVSRDLSAGLLAGTLHADDNHLSRTPMKVDQQGWEEVLAVLEETLERLLQIREQAAVRIAETGVEPIHASVSILQFELPRKPPV